MVERLTVNQDVAGSNPAGGAIDALWCSGNTGDSESLVLGSNPRGAIMKCKCRLCKEIFDSWKSYRHCKRCRGLLPPEYNGSN